MYMNIIYIRPYVTIVYMQINIIMGINLIQDEDMG